MSEGPSSRRMWIAAALVVAIAIVALLATRQRLSVGGALDSGVMAVGSTSSRASGRPGSLVWQPVRPIGGHGESAPEAEIGTFEGQVRSLGTGRGVSNVQLSFVGPGGALTAATDMQGKFVLRPPREGLYELVLAQAEGFLPLATELGDGPVELRAIRGRALREITLWLAPAIMYVGLVVDQAERPVSGARVTLADPDENVISFGALATSFITDQKGEVRFVAPEGTLVEATHPAHGRGTARLDFGALMARQITVVLRPLDKSSMARIYGRVVDPLGTPVPDVVVTATTELNAATDAAHENIGGHARTTAGGEFALEVSPGPYTVLARDGHLAPARKSVVATRAASDPVLLVLANGATLRGSVKDAKGKPIASFTVIVTRATGIARESVAIRSFVDVNGSYELGALPSGPHLVTAVSADHAPSDEREISLVSGASAEADLVLHPGARLTGIVRDAKTKQPLREANVALEGYQGSSSSGGAPLVPTTHTDEAGGFELRGISRGRHSVLVTAPSHHGRVVGGILVSDAEPPAPLDVSLTPTDKGEEPRIELVGIGAALSAKGEALVIGKVMPGGGAAEAGLLVGDLVQAIDGARVSALGFEGAIQRIRGPEGTTVTLLIERGEQGELTVIVPRRRVKS